MPKTDSFKSDVARNLDDALAFGFETLCYDVEPNRENPIAMLDTISEIHAWAKQHGWHVVVTRADNPRMRTDPNVEDIRCLLFHA